MEGGTITRRQMLKGAGLVGGGALLGSGFTLAGMRWQSGGTTARDPGSPRLWYELGLIGEPIMDNQLLFHLSLTGQGMSELGECLDTASRIEAADLNSWPKEWLTTAKRVRMVAETSLEKGHKRSAGEACLRAANYYRAALIHRPNPGDPGVLRAGRRSVACFDKALETLSIPARPVRIPYEGAALPGYFFRSPLARDRAPVLISARGATPGPRRPCGADGTSERGYH